MSDISRRRFLQISSVMAGASMLPMPVKWLGRSDAQAFYQTSGIPLFKTSLRIVELPICMPDSSTAPITGVKHYTIYVREYRDQIIPTSYTNPVNGAVTPTGYGPTTLWGYHPAVPLLEAIGAMATQPQTHLGGLILANRGEPIQITFKNQLNTTYDGKPLTKHIIPNDLTIPGANGQINRIAIHLHGSEPAWIFDGGPFDWWTPDGAHGLSFRNNETVNPNAGPGDAEYHYNNDQSARFIWYHDHAFGITRINAYAGLASAYLIRDKFEANLISTMGLPPTVESSALGGTAVQEIPLVFQDKVFVGSNIKLLDPSWKNIVSASAQSPGSLWYPHLYEPNRWRKTFGKPLPNPSVIAEMFGDTMLVNGTVFPEQAVEPRRYRLRLLNACNARFLNLQLYLDDGSPNGITLDAAGLPTNAPFVNAATGKASVINIATEAGFQAIAAEVPMNVPFSLNAVINPLNPVGQGSLIVGCAERFDLLVDFTAAAGQKVILYNDAPAPFPGGDPRNDYFPGLANGNPVNAKTKAGFGPNTRVLMRFVVGSTASSADSPLAIAAGTNFSNMAPVGGHPWNMDLIVPLNAAGVPDVWNPLTGAFDATKLPAGVNVRRISLNEDFDPWGRLRQMVGTDVVQPYGGYGQEYLASVRGEDINLAGAASVTEIWEIANLTADVHPMHIHLANAQILKRQSVDMLAPFLPRADNTVVDAFNFNGPPRPPEATEIGFKETFKMNPGEVITIIQNFTLPPIKNADGTVTPTPLSLRTGDHEYVWHCHILEHEEHDMMRPLVVKA